MLKKLRISIELTNHCNFRCVYCPQSTYQLGAGPGGNPFDRPKGFMSSEIMERARQAAIDHARDLTIGFFGEQLLHPRFSDFVRSLPSRPKRRWPLWLNTNWSLVTDSLRPALYAFDVVRISLDAVCAEQWNRLCPGGSVLDESGRKGADRFQTLTDKLKWWLALPDHPPTNLIYVSQQENAAQARQFAHRWQPFLSPRDQVITKSVLTYGGVMSDPYMSSNLCRVADQNRFTIGWDGRCSPCNLDVNLAMAVANIADFTVPEILASGGWSSALRNIRKKRGICAHCFDAQNHGRTVYQGTRRQ